jgi:hypothetical protein
LGLEPATFRLISIVTQPLRYRVRPTRNVIVILIYHRHKPIDLILTSAWNNRAAVEFPSTQLLIPFGPCAAFECVVKLQLHSNQILRSTRSATPRHAFPLGRPLICPRLEFFSDNCFFVLPVGRPLWREDGSVTYSAIAEWSGHWHYRLIWNCVPSSSPLTTRRDYGGGILTRLHTGPLLEERGPLIINEIHERIDISKLVSASILSARKYFSSIVWLQYAY